MQSTRSARAPPQKWRMSTTIEMETIQLLQLLNNHHRSNTRRSNQSTLAKLRLYATNPTTHRLAIADLARRSNLPTIRANRTRPDRFDFIVDNTSALLSPSSSSQSSRSTIHDTPEPLPKYTTHDNLPKPTIGPKPSDSSSLSSSWSMAVTRLSQPNPSQTTTPPHPLPRLSTNPTHDHGSTTPPNTQTAPTTLTPPLPHPIQDTPLPTQAPLGSTTPSTHSNPTSPLATPEIDAPIIFQPIMIPRLSTSPAQATTPSQHVPDTDSDTPATPQGLTDRQFLDYCDQRIQTMFLAHGPRLLTEATTNAIHSTKQWLASPAATPTLVSLLSQHVDTIMDPYVDTRIQQLDLILGDRTHLAMTQLKTHVDTLKITATSDHATMLSSVADTQSKEFEATLTLAIASITTQVQTILDTAVSEMSEHVAIHKTRLTQHIQDMPLPTPTPEQLAAHHILLETQMQASIQVARSAMEQATRNALDAYQQDLTKLAHTTTWEQTRSASPEPSSFQTRHYPAPPHIHSMADTADLPDQGLHYAPHPHQMKQPPTSAPFANSRDHRPLQHPTQDHYTRHTNPYTQKPTSSSSFKDPDTRRPIRHPVQDHSIPSSMAMTERDKRATIQRFANASFDHTLHTSDAKSIMRLYHALYFLCNLHQIPLKHADHLTRNAPLYPEDADYDPDFRFYSSLLYEKLNSDDPLASCGTGHNRSTCPHT